MLSSLTLGVSDFKVLSICLTLCLAIGALFLPQLVKNANIRALSVANIFGGGVFLAAALCHLLAEGHEHMEEYYEFPMAYVLAGLGFITTLSVEEFVHWFSHLESNTDNEDDHTLLNADFVSESSSHLDHHHDHHHDHDESHGHSHATGLDQSSSVLSSIVLWIALSFHSIMEGLALGADKEKNDSILIAILAHKGIESFALGTSLLRSPIANTRKYYLFLFGFAFMTPLGILLGMLIEKTVEDALISIYITCFTSGTFLYVSICEVILNETKRPHDKLLKFIALSLGFGGMAILAKWV